MNLYLISQSRNNGYDSFDSAIVVAATKKEAVEIHPQLVWGHNRTSSYYWNQEAQYLGTWCPSSDDVTAVLIGTAAEHLEAGSVVLASFNAG